MSDSYDEFIRAVRGDEPVKIEDPNSGFNLDQMYNETLQRIGKRFYSIEFEAIIESEVVDELTSTDIGDNIIIDSNEMGYYALSDSPTPEDFSDANMWYSTSNESQGGLEGSGKLVYADLDSYFEENQEELGLEFDDVEKESPDVILATDSKRDEFEGLDPNEIQAWTGEQVSVYVHNQDSY